MSPTLPSRFAVALKMPLIFLAMLAGALTLRAQESLEGDAALQSKAPEAVATEITHVDKLPEANGLQVTANATIVKVTRTATGLKAGDAITISYVQPQRAAGSAIVAGTIPVVIEGRTYAAYLQGGPAPVVYTPAAQGQTFVVQKDWPTPANPLPKGWVDGTLRAVHLTQNGTQYFAGINKPPSTWPLLAAVQPELLHYYQSSADTPNVKILVYRAGMVTVPGATSPLAVDRAVIITNPGNRAVGDALWAVEPSAGAAAPGQPVWHWTADTLTVKNPFQMTIQEISLKQADAK